MAVFLDALGRRDEAFAELERAVVENSSRLYSIDTDPKIDGLRRHPRFARLRDRLQRTTERTEITQPSGALPHQEA
jgi:hypothetical protein